MSVGDELEMLVLGTQNKKLFSGTLKVGNAGLRNTKQKTFFRYPKGC